MSGKFLVRKGPKVASKFGKFVYEWSGFHKYGLRHDDCLDDQFDPVVKAAVEMLPREEYDERVWRIFRALDASMRHTYLPEEEWTEYEEDERYLEPYMDAIKKEREEQKKWDNGSLNLKSASQRKCD